MKVTNADALAPEHPCAAAHGAYLTFASRKGSKDITRNLSYSASSYSLSPSIDVWGSGLCAVAMSLKVVAVAAGEAHTVALAGDGSVYAWGRGAFGRLGTGRENDELVPLPVPIAFDGESSRRKFTAIAAGAYHNLALADDGSVWTWGYNAYGQLGNSEDNASVPCLVEHFQELTPPESSTDDTSIDHVKGSLKISAVKAGGMMSLAIDSLGALWIWGNCPHPTEDGKLSLQSSSIPLPVWDFHGHSVLKVACGNEHVVAAVSAGETFTGSDLVLYAWGNNNHGQLGLGEQRSSPRPQAISTFDKNSSWAVYEIACGAYHTAVLTHKKSYDQDIESKCWTFGLGENGQLGHGTSKNSFLPEPVDGLPRDTFLISLDCGLFHTSVVSSAGDVWAWGMERGLGLCPDASYAGIDTGDALSPLRIQSPETDGSRFSDPVQVACGAAHTVLVAGNGYKLWAWGRGRSGVLGRGQTTDSYVPCTVMWPLLELDFKKEEPKKDVRLSKSTSNEGKLVMEMEQKLSLAMEEINSLRSKLSLMERYANVLHVSIFRKALDERTLSRTMQESGVFDIGKELEHVMEKADTEELTRMEMFYHSMLSSVKDRLLKRRVQEIVKECLASLSAGRQQHHSMH